MSGRTISSWGGGWGTGAWRCAIVVTVMATSGVLIPPSVQAAPSCDRLVDGGVRDCNMRLSLDSHELLDQTTVTLTPAQAELARKQRPLRELEPSPEQFGQLQAYCRGHGEIRRRIGIQQGLCAEPAAD